MTARYAIVDCARDPRLHAWVKSCPEHACLFAGQLAPTLEEAAPHLVRLDDGYAFANRWDRDASTQAWGITCRSPLDLAGLRRHLRHFLQARLPDGRVVLFRFYDPRVWAVYWPTLDEGERAPWMKGVEGWEA